MSNLKFKIKEVPVITIDGPVGVGKGTVSLRVANQLGWHTLDSGAMYRVLALAAQRHALNLKDELALANLAIHLDVHFEALPDLSGVQVILYKQEVTQALRTEVCGTIASQIAVFPAVRQALLIQQQAFRRAPGLVADGRDMGTVVFQNAPIKVFLTATCEERAQRRYKQLKAKGINVKLASIFDEIVNRDKRDSTRAIAPLVPAVDAHIIDTTEIPIENVVVRILRMSRKELGIEN